MRSRARSSHWGHMGTGSWFRRGRPHPRRFRRRPLQAIALAGKVALAAQASLLSVHRDPHGHRACHALDSSAFSCPDCPSGQCAHGPFMPLVSALERE